VVVMVLKACVVGAGVIGLSSACRLIEQSSLLCSVTLIADSFLYDTTSDGAFGLWEPYFSGDTPKERVRKWAADSLDHMLSLSRSEEGGRAGAFILHGYQVFKEAEQLPWWSDMCVWFRNMNEKELKRYPNYKYGWAYGTAATECRTYLPWLLKRFQEKGGSVIKRKLKNLTELYDDYDIVINCTGLGAAALCNDTEVYPIKGQTIRVTAPWLKHFTVADADEENLAYILPGANNVVLGGTLDRGNWDKTPSVQTRERIWRDCMKLEPSLKHAVRQYDWAGLRPARTSIRVEREHVKHKDRNITVVHNYGHGGCGVCLHWGCAGEAVQLAIQEYTPTAKL